MFWHLIFQSGRRSRLGGFLKNGLSGRETNSEWSEAGVGGSPPPPPHLSTLPLGGRICGSPEAARQSYREELHLQKHSEPDSWIFIRWLDALIYPAATRRSDGSGGARLRQRLREADPTLHVFQRKMSAAHKTPDFHLWLCSSRAQWSRSVWEASS